MKTTFRRLGAAARAFCLLAGFIAASQTANAACTGPAGNAGDQRFATNYGVMAFCDGTNWISMAGGVSVTVNTSGGGATPAGASADVQFNSSGALAADTGNFTYSSGLLTTPNFSTGNVSATTVNATGLGTLGSLLVAGGEVTFSGALQAMRWNMRRRQKIVVGESFLCTSSARRRATRKRVGKCGPICIRLTFEIE